MPSEDRLDCTIDGEPVLSLDISASQPTLLSAFLGVKLDNTSAQKNWYDPYLQLSGLTFAGMPSDPTGEELEDTIKRNRKIAKGVVMELIGTGNVNKEKPSDDLVTETGVTQDEWDHFKQALRRAIPALEKLEPRYNSAGELSGYINGPAFLMYHESEIMMQTLETLRDEWDIPAYPVHDCLLVKEKDWETALKVFTQTISDYSAQLSGVPITVPISRESRTLAPRRFKGFYGLENEDQFAH